MKPEITVNDRMIKDVQSKLVGFEKRAPTVVSAALNRAMTTMTKQITVEARSRYHIKVKDVRPTLKKSKANRSNLSATVLSTGRTIPLDRFVVTPRTVQPKRKKPILVAVKKGPKKPLPGAFVGDIQGVKVFKRKTKKRLPIGRLFGPSVPQMISGRQVQEEVYEAGRIMFYKRLDHEIKRILSKGASV
ncbi:hypothetical protein EVJ32_09610 [Exiguobacterium sp. SH5S4]|uniref:phage tail protein n=1 Tax=Exiguobacterium sp. SH5S4 TaxID=2510961 RepID=UPI00103F77D2|nr:phage tail protein [Exiguobacterium sp. SH5S4]TCI25568.1 hypothetical protein EVJ32_09610 [Exiguobacterium sp. SH5S4]